MAYIPDQAIDSMDQISSRAFRLYCYYCKHGSMRKDRIRVDLKSAARDLFKGDLSNAAKYHRELKAEKWILQDPISHEITLSKGNFYPAKSEDPEPENDGAEVVNFTTESEPKVVVNFTTEKESLVVNSTTSSGKNYHSHNKDSLTSQLTSQEKTKKETKKKRPVKPLTKIPDDFELTDPMLEWIEQNTPQLEPVLAFAEFKRYWQRQEGKKALKKDWLATFKQGMWNLLDWGKCYKDENKKGDEKNGNSFTGSTPDKPAGSTGSTNGSTQTGAGSNSGKYRHTAGANPIIIE